MQFFFVWPSIRADGNHPDLLSACISEFFLDHVVVLTCSFSELPIIVAPEWKVCLRSCIQRYTKGVTWRAHKGGCVTCSGRICLYAFQFDKRLCSSWDKAMEDGHFRYKLDIEETRIVGEKNYVCQVCFCCCYFLCWGILVCYLYGSVLLACW